MDWRANHGIAAGGNLTNTGAMAVGSGASATVHGAAGHDPRPAGSSIRIFINYRSQDDPSTAALLKRELSRHFGQDNVFIDNSMIPPGKDFEVELLGRVRRSDVLLAVIGPRWLSTLQQGDWVCRELAEAFANGVPVVPVLVDDTLRLTTADLPGDIARLTRCQYLMLRHPTIDDDLARLIDQLDTHIRRW